MAQQTIDIIQLTHPDTGDVFYPQTHADGVIGLGTAAKTNSTAYATSTQGSHADTIYNLINGNKSVNTVLAGPASGSAGAASFRKLVAADIPNLDWSKITSGKPTTIAGYGITDAKFGTEGTDYIPVTLGSITKNVLTAHQSLANYLSRDGGSMNNTNVVTNLNADLLDGQHSSYYAAASSLANYVTLASNQTITGTKTISTSGYGNQLIVKRNERNYDAMIRFENATDGLLGYIGIRGSGSNKVPAYSSGGTTETTYTLYHSGNANLSTVNWEANQMTANSFKLASGTPTLTWDATNSAWHLSGNFYADGFVSSGGLSTGSGTSGIDEAAMWSSLGEVDATKKINISHLPYVAGTNIEITSAGLINNTYTLPVASSSVFGGIKIGYTTSGKNYAVQLSDGKAYVNVPWENTTYTVGSGVFKIAANGGTAVNTLFNANVTSGTTGVNFINGNYITASVTAASGTTPAQVKFTHNTSGVTSGSYGDSGNQTPAYGGTFNVPYITVDTYGHITGISSHTVKIPASDNTDTKNTAGSTDTSSKIFLIGATSQAANPQTYSDNEVYVTSGTLTTNKVQIGGTAVTVQYNSTDTCIEFIFN